MRILAWAMVCALGCAPQKGASPSSGSSGSNGGSGGSTGASVTSTGMSGGSGGSGSTGSTGSTTSGSACTPFSSWCDGNMLMNCTRSGMDATGYDCTKLTTSMLTYSCVSACPNEPANFGPCCSYTTGSTGGTTGSPTKPTCVAAITAPNAVSGDNTNFPAGISCSPPSVADCPGLGAGSVTFFDEPKTCPPSGWNARIAWDRSQVVVGQPVTTVTSSSSIVIDYTDVASNNDCYQWTGSVTLNSDAPSWKVTFDVTCSSGLSVHLAGTLSGTVSP